MLSAEDLSKIRYAIKHPNGFWTHYTDCDCYMYALKIDLYINDISSIKKPFMVGSFSDRTRYMGNARELEKSLYTDLDAIGLNVTKEDLELNENEWLIAMYKSTTPIMLKSGVLMYNHHFIRKDYGDKRWRYKPGSWANISKVRFPLFKEKTPENVKVKCNYLDGKVEYQYVGTYKLSMDEESFKNI